MTTTSETRKVSLAESELTLSGVLTINTAELASHIPLGSALELSMQVVRLVAETHDKGDVVGVLDAAHLICAPTGALTIGGAGGNPLAPELKRGDMPDRLTDVYALGALIYRLLTGKRVDPNKLIEPPSHFNPAVDTSLDELVLEALDEDPSERPYSARELERRMVEIFEDLGLEPDSNDEAVQLIKKAKPVKKAAPPPTPIAAAIVAKPAPVAKAAPAPVAKPKPVRVAAPPPLRFADAENTLDSDDDDTDYGSNRSAGGLDKKWMIVGGVGIAVLLALFFAWPSSGKKHHATASAPVAAETAAKPEAPSAPKVEAHLVEATPETGAGKTTVTKMIVKSTVRSPRSGRR